MAYIPMDEPPHRLALRALRDLGAVCASFNHPGFRALRIAGLAKGHICIDSDKATYRLTERGRQEAMRLPLWPNLPARSFF